jgi:hypothetical protein
MACVGASVVARGYLRNGENQFVLRLVVISLLWLCSLYIKSEYNVQSGIIMFIPWQEQFF